MNRHDWQILWRTFSTHQEDSEYSGAFNFEVLKTSVYCKFLCYIMKEGTGRQVRMTGVSRREPLRNVGKMSTDLLYLSL